MLLGVQEECFRYPLEAGETFYAPEVILSYTDQGMNRLSQNLHSCIRHHICRGKYKTEVRPVLVNSWEAAYFDFTGETLYNLAKEARSLVSICWFWMTAGLENVTMTTVVLGLVCQ